MAMAPGYAAPGKRLGEVMVRLGPLTPAMRAFEAVRTADPDDPLGPWGVAVVMLKSGQREQALATIERELPRMPDQPLLHRLHGDTLAALGRREEALRAYDRALALEPDEATRQARQRLAPASR
jgi:predicted RNA polymerase sigma factor